MFRLLLALAAPAWAAPITLSHQVRLVDADGAPFEGAHDLRLTLWADATSTDAGDRLWTYEFQDVAVQGGYASLDLAVGDGSVSVDSDWFAGSVWVGVSVDQATEMSPRMALVSAPAAGYAHVSERTRGVVATTTAAGTGCSVGGALGWNDTSAQLLVCDGTVWRSISTSKTIVAGAGGVRRWSDGSVADSCEHYRRPGSDGLYLGSTGDGLYAIDPDGTGATYGEITVYCDQTHHEGGWTLAISAGLNTNLVSSSLTGDSLPYASSAAQPGNGALHKMSDALINAIRTASGSQIAYWVTTPGSGTGTLGAEIFHRGDCTFQMYRTESNLRSTTCDEWTITYSNSPSWAAGGYWWMNNANYYWAFGHGNAEILGTQNVCHADGRGLGVHTDPYEPFHRGWCATQAWGQVWVR